MATKSIAWQSGSGNITLTYTGQGNGTIQVESDENDLGTQRSQVITVETLNGAVTRNLTINQAACPFPVGDVKDFSYTANVQSILLPAGTYKLQCWGAQGGSNAAASTYSITEQAGGKGGYSEGILTLSTPTTVYIFVGGQGASSGNGGWNGGGGGNGTTQYNSGNTYGYTKVGCGGGATDIALITSTMNYSSYRTNRSAASYLSRLIVAGGGSGGAMSYTAVTSTTYSWESIYNNGLGAWNHIYDSPNNRYVVSTGFSCGSSGTVFLYGETYRVTYTGNGSLDYIGINYWNGSTAVQYNQIQNGGTHTIQNKSQNTIEITIVTNSGSADLTGTIEIEKRVSSTVTTTSNDFSTGMVGGGTSGGGSYPGTQRSAGSGGGFGYGANQQATNNRYHAGLGGGGWYGGGSLTADSSPSSYMGYSGGGSGFVNTAASAGNRPSGYTGLQLDSGETKAGNSSFPAPGGGNETGHAGNGYARITRLS